MGDQIDEYSKEGQDYHEQNPAGLPQPDISLRKMSAKIAISSQIQVINRKNHRRVQNRSSNGTQFSFLLVVAVRKASAFATVV